jgi:hypothetical protein
MATTDTTRAGNSGQPQTDLISELRRAAAAIDAAWTSRQPAGGQAEHGGPQTGAEEPSLPLRVHHLHKMAALCSMAARLLLQRAASGEPPDSDVQPVRQFLEAQLAGTGAAEPPGSPATFCPTSAHTSPATGIVPPGGQGPCSCDRRPSQRFRKGG